MANRSPDPPPPFQTPQAKSLREWPCARCGRLLPGHRFKDLWNLGWRPIDFVEPVSRHPSLRCPECQRSPPE